MLQPKTLLTLYGRVQITLYGTENMIEIINMDQKLYTPPIILHRIGKLSSCIIRNVTYYTSITNVNNMNKAKLGKII